MAQNGSKTKVNVLREHQHLDIFSEQTGASLQKIWRDAFSRRAHTLASIYHIEIDFWSKSRPKMVNIEVFEKRI